MLPVTSLPSSQSPFSLPSVGGQIGKARVCVFTHACALQVSLESRGARGQSPSRCSAAPNPRSESLAYESAAPVNVGLITGCWQELRRALERKLGSYSRQEGWGRTSDLLSMWMEASLHQEGTLGRYFGLSCAIQAKLRACKALTSLIERESFWGGKCQQR